MQNLSIDQQIRIVINESFSKRRLFVFLSSVICLSIVVTGHYWPRVYESSTSLLWNNAQAMQPLLGRDRVVEQRTTIVEQVNLASAIIFSNKNLDTLVEKAGLNIKVDGQKMSAREIELLKGGLRRKIHVGRSGDRIIRISYRDPLPEIAYLVVSIMSSLFIEETAQNKKSSSRENYEFIEKQVIDYQQKLQLINRTIADFKKKNIDLQVDSTEGVNTRVLGIREELKNDKLNLNEAIIRSASLKEQMIAESARNVVAENENIKEQRLRTLEDQLNTLRLSYTDTYPDIIQIREQIKNLKISIAEDSKIRSTQRGQEASQGQQSEPVVETPLYQRLSEQQSVLITQIKTLRARIENNEKLAAMELNRSTEVNLIASELDDLTRDYEVTKEIYNDLLRRRESARVSLNLELESAASIFITHEPPVVPLVPAGLRFLHFVIIGVVLGGVTPLAIITGLLIIGQRIRHEDELLDNGDFDVIGVIPRYQRAVDLKRERTKTIQCVLIIFFTGAALVLIILNRFVAWI